MKKLAIVTTHPIQYNAPIFRLLSQDNRVGVKVFYTWQSAQGKVFDPGFGKAIEWDIPLLEGYEYTFVKNKSEKPNQPKSFWSIQNPSLIAEIEDWGADAVLVFGWNFYSHLQVMRYFKNKIPVLFRGDSTLLNEGRGVKTILRRAALTAIYKYVDYALYVGQQNKKYYLKHGVKPEQLVFAPHAIDNDRFLKDPEGMLAKQAGEMLKSLQIPEEAVVFLFAGKLEAVKNPGLLLSAFASLPETFTHLIIVGNGHLERALKQRFQSASNIHFLDFQNQSKMPYIYRMADVFVLGSDSETWGLAVNEAMACGRAVLVSDKVGCAVDLVQPNVNGYVFEAGNLESLQSSLALFASKTKDQLSDMGESSKNIISAWSYDRICVAVTALMKA